MAGSLACLEGEVNPKAPGLLRINVGVIEGNRAIIRGKGKGMVWGLTVYSTGDNVGPTSEADESLCLATGGFYSYEGSYNRQWRT